MPPEDTNITSDASDPAAGRPRPRGRLRRFAGGLGRCLRCWLCLRRLLLLVLVAVVCSALYSWLAYYQAWRQALRSEGFVEEMAAPQAGDRIVIFAPHPDDEVLACGGLIQQALAAGAQVNVVLMTNGDASELSLIFGEKDLLVSPRAMVELGTARQEESLRALAALGLPKDHVYFLSYPNNGLTALWQPGYWFPSRAYRSPYTHTSRSPYRRSFTSRAPYCGQLVLSDTVALLQQLRPTKLLVPHPKDIHPDHWATSCFVQYGLATVAARGGEWATETEVLGYLVHWPRFPAPARVSLKTELLPPADLTNAQSRWLKLPLSPEAATRKLQAIRDYSSQVPNFDRLLLKFARANETFERLDACSLAAGQQLRVTDRGGHRRGLGGAEVDSLSLLVNPNRHLRATVENGGRDLGRRSYIALDVRGWDAHGAPVLTEAQIQSSTRGRALYAVGNALTDRPLQVARHGEGVSLGLAVPPELAESRGFFLSCWGSVKDKSVDSLAVMPVRPDNAR